ncbi:FKBP-type peptidyl-prolyl cis-trans isomerase [Pedobacter africanus]|uniref:Peptidyl-prolyl cis-trans isomerase n=1 Tax=Pedobacter africanus TaxID=151894 RepID=A0A1W2BXH5_9SPHI|nr:FKBP-type peptidyl-prolyl cis-trans isomerase [Pedobacter africanus]SMC77677.1 FKBP-type peptidyl-prolyl cis-trans isomerase FkpA [Pedobacter africanus]
MLKTSALLGGVFIAGMFAACEKPAPYDEAGQALIDDAIIVKYMKDSNVVATKDPSGLYYNLIKTGKDEVNPTDTAWALYTARILKDTIDFDKSLDTTFKFNTPGYFMGWKRGVELAKVGGKVRLLIPSTLAYQNRAVSIVKTIPPNSILDITLEILSVNKDPKSRKND